MKKAKYYCKKCKRNHFHDSPIGRQHTSSWSTKHSAVKQETVANKIRNILKDRYKNESNVIIDNYIQHCFDLFGYQAYDKLSPQEIMNEYLHVRDYMELGLTINNPDFFKDR